MRKFICEFCGKEFTPKYARPKDKVLKCCSKSCKTKLQIKIQKNYVFYNKETLEYAISNLIKEKNRYLTYCEITNNLKVSKKTLNKFKISIVALNKLNGFKKPKSKFEESVYGFLCDIYSYENIDREVKFSNCLSPKDAFLFFDFYIKNENIIIEADGDQHSNKNNPWYSEYYSEICESIKNKYCKDNNIKLIRIPYNRKVDLFYIKSFLN